MFEVHYVSECGWEILYNGQPWDSFYYDSEWEALNALEYEYPRQARELKELHSRVG